jgi:uncharacterized membrane protein YvbJ
VAVKCPKCHSKNPETVKFCGECGTQLPAFKDARKEEVLLEIEKVRRLPFAQADREKIFSGNIVRLVNFET